MEPNPQECHTWVIYHAECLDGFGAAWAAWKALGKTAHYLPVQHGQPMPELPAGLTLYILDFCYPPEVLCLAASHAKHIVVLDHHVSAKTACEDFLTRTRQLPENLILHFDLERSGCRLAWEYFHSATELPPLLAHVEDRDLWRHQLPGTREITLALYPRLPLPFAEVERLNLTDLRTEGTFLLGYQERILQRLLEAAHPLDLLGVSGLAVNAPTQFASELGEALARRSGTFGLVYHFHGGRNRWECSLRSQDDFDVAALATRLGGGGHRNAAGFKLPANQPPWQVGVGKDASRSCSADSARQSRQSHSLSAE